MKHLLIAAVAACLAASISAKEVARVATTNEILVLTDEQAQCQSGTQVAVWGGKGKEPVTGCWFEAFGVVWVMFDDGDRVGLPRKVFKAPTEV